MQLEITIDGESKVATATADRAENQPRVFHDAEREQTSILAPLERAARYGFARRMPAWAWRTSAAGSPTAITGDRSLW